MDSELRLKSDVEVWTDAAKVTLNPTTQRAVGFLGRVRDKLIEKQAGYGDAAKPMQVFATTDPIESIRHRIDQKLHRIQELGVSSHDEDTLEDLVGYLALLRALEELNAEKV